MFLFLVICIKGLLGCDELVENAIIDYFSCYLIVFAPILPKQNGVCCEKCYNGSLGKTKLSVLKIIFLLMSLNKNFY